MHYLGERRQQFNPVLHALIPIAAIVLFGFALYYQYAPLPAAPIVVGDWVALGWLVVGLAALVAARRWLPDESQRARNVFGDESPLEASSEDQQLLSPPIGEVNARD